MTTPQHWKPAVMVWKWADAPDEFRSLFGENGDEESVVYVPAALVGAGGDFDSPTAGLNFLDFPSRYSSHEQCAGDDWGWYRLVALDDGGRVAVTRHSGR